MVNLGIKKNGNTIEMDVDSLQHIMACMANEKFLNAPPANGDQAEAELNGEADKVWVESRNAIDDCYLQIEEVVCA